MRALLFGLALIIAAPALAALPPEYYDQARHEAPNVIVIEVSEVGQPPVMGYGECRVRGRVIGVLRGSRYRTGAPIVVAVPCMHRGARIPASGTIYQDFEHLRRMRYGRAYLNDAGQLALSQYEALSEWTEALPYP